MFEPGKQDQKLLDCPVTVVWGAWSLRPKTQMQEMKDGQSVAEPTGKAAERLEDLDESMQLEAIFDLSFVDMKIHENT